jgi:hypothetical protein
VGSERVDPLRANNRLQRTALRAAAEPERSVSLSWGRYTTHGAGGVAAPPGQGCCPCQDWQVLR